MEENIKSFSKGFVGNQSRIAELEQENKKLKEICDKYVPMALRLEDENKKLKADYIKLSKIVETTGGYKASYVNELRDKIAKLEFDIEARKEWKKALGL